MTVGILSPGLEKPKFLNCSVSNQISGEGYLWLLWVFCGLIFSRNTPQSYLFMTQVDFMLFLRFWVRSIQALPNLVRWLPNSGILFITPPHVCGKSKKSIKIPRNHFFSLILHLPVNSSLWFTRKKNGFHRLTFSNLVFGVEFACNGTMWIHHDLSHVLETKFQFKEDRMMF